MNSGSGPTSEFRWPVRVYIEDTDAGGIVYYVNYLKFMERARTEFLRHLGFDHAQMIREGSMVVIHSAQIEYLKPAQLDDDLEVNVRVVELKRSSLVFEQEIFCPSSGQRIVKARIKGACVTKASLKPCAMPEVMRQELQKWLTTTT